MRGVGLTLVTTCCTLACAQPPAAVGEREAVVAGQGEGETEGELPPTPTGTPTLDPTLAQMRTQVRGARLPEAARRALLDSPNPDHRHAARLLQAIAGEVPAPVLPRTSGGVGERPNPSPTESPSPAPRDAPLDERDTAPFDVAPEWAELVPGSPVWSWFASGGLTLVARHEPESPTRATPAPTTEFGSPELPLLLREPVLAARAGPVRDPAPLVILTRLDLQSGASEGQALLELAGASSVTVTSQPLSASGDRLRLWIADAGAVPAFTSARPALDALAIVGVQRRDRQVWIDVELAPGWALQGSQPQVNGATVSFARAAASP
jgi:hypothetical protein